MYANTAFPLRWRTTLESIDGGIVLFRSFFRQIYTFFLPLYLAVSITASLLPVDLIWIGFLVIWWFHPLWDRLILHPIGTLFFDPAARMSQLKRGIFRGMFAGLLGDVTWRRFSLKRSFVLPIRILEKLKGKPLAGRVGVVANDVRGSVFLLLSILCVCQIGLLTSEFSFVTQIVQFFPSYMRPEISTNSPAFLRFLLLAYAANSLILIPLRFCLSFSLYLNRRITSEGWDLELSFRNLVIARDRTAARRSGAKTTLVLTACLFLCITAPGGLYAQEGGTISTAPLVDLEQVLSSEDFGGFRERTAFRWKTGREREAAELPNYLSRLRNINISAWTLRGIVSVGALILVGWIVWVNRRQIHLMQWWSGRARGRINEQDSQHPVIQAAEASPLELFELGHTRQAWAQVYKQLVMHMATIGGIDVDSSTTEGALIGAFTKLSGEVVGLADVQSDVKNAVRSWQRVAYAHYESEASSFHQALGLLEILAARGSDSS